MQKDFALKKLMDRENERLREQLHKKKTKPNKKERTGFARHMTSEENLEELIKAEWVLLMKELLKDPLVKERKAKCDQEVNELAAREVAREKAKEAAVRLAERTEAREKAKQAKALNKFREQEAKRRERERVKAAKDAEKQAKAAQKAATKARKAPARRKKSSAVLELVEEEDTDSAPEDLGHSPEDPIELPAPVPRPRARPWNKGKARTTTQTEPELSSPSNPNPASLTIPISPNPSSRPYPRPRHVPQASLMRDGDENVGSDRRGPSQPSSGLQAVLETRGGVAPSIVAVNESGEPRRGSRERCQT